MKPEMLQFLDELANLLEKYNGGIYSHLGSGGSIHVDINGDRLNNVCIGDGSVKKIRTIISSEIHSNNKIWQPIETAPKNGSYVLLSVQYPSEISVVIASYEDDYWVCDDDQSIQLGTPIYWMPLPPAPTK